jgi:heme-degrading monooxygenase HmoA
MDGFDWAGCIASAIGGPWYLVVFRSIRRPGADADVLTEFDDRAHLEARDAGGLRLYFKGVPTPARECLSLCLWDSAEEAHRALRLPGHQAAVRIAHGMYERFALERHTVARDPRDGRVRITPV